MKIAIHSPENAEIKDQLVKALALVFSAYPTGQVLEKLGIERELSTEDKERMVKAEAKRQRRAQRNKDRE